MNKLDIRSLMIGVLGTILFFVLIGATEDGNLGDIAVSYTHLTLPTNREV